MSIPFLRLAVLAAALCPTGGFAASLTLDAALGLAATRSESAHAARAGASSAVEAARAAGQLPDPMLRVGIDNLPVTGPDRFRTTRESMTMKRIGLSQEWLSANKRSARRAAAEATVRREALQARAAIAETQLQTAIAYVDAFYAAEALKLATEMEHHAHEQFEAARGRLASSTGSSQDVLATTSARGMAEDDSAEIRQQRGAAAVVLQRWTGVATDDLAPLPVLAAPAEPDFVGAHPAVVAVQREIEVARLAAAETATNRSPNWTWEASYGQRTGYSDLVSIGVSIPLPIAPGQRQDRDTAMKLALVDKAEAELAEAIRAATAEYRLLTGDALRLAERIERYRLAVALPATQRTAAATAAYRSNQATLATLFEARHAEVDAQRKLLALERELAKTRVQLAFRPLAPEVLP